MIEKNQDRRIGTKQVRTVMREIPTNCKLKDKETLVEHFDDEVNLAIRDGWKLSRRYTITAGSAVFMVAELSRFV
ncbi:MAG: hypothetical protein IKY89_05705 [Alistipes sp.]|nr:hypothetical protein [Alistipes sp.]